MIRIVLSTVLALAVAAPGWSMMKDCAVRAQAEEHLKSISASAYQVKVEADYLDSALRNPMVDWRILAERLTLLRENVSNLRRDLNRLESAEMKFTDAERREVERLKGAVATMTVFLNNALENFDQRTYWVNREKMRNEAKAIHIRAGLVREVVRNLRTASLG